MIIKYFFTILIKSKALFLMNIFIVCGILLEVAIAIGGIYLIKKLKRSQKRQPTLSKKIIKNLKF